MKLHFQKAIMTSCRTEAGLLVEWRSEAGPFDFCRAMLCISAAYAVMRCLCVCVCLSACHVRVSCQNEFFSPSGSHNILVFLCQTA